MITLLGMSQSQRLIMTYAAQLTLALSAIPDFINEPSTFKASDLRLEVF